MGQRHCENQRAKPAPVLVSITKLFGSVDSGAKTLSCSGNETQAAQESEFDPKSSRWYDVATRAGDIFSVTRCDSKTHQLVRAKWEYILDLGAGFFHERRSVESPVATLFEADDAALASGFMEA